MQNYNLDYENEFNLMMDFFGEPYKTCHQRITIIDLKDRKEKIYKIDTREGMMEYYIEICCSPMCDIYERVGDFMKIWLSDLPDEMRIHLSNCIACDLLDELEDIDGTKLN